MLTVVQRGGATREKPPEVVRGFASRLPWVWDGLCFGVTFADATRDAARDLVWGAPPSAVSGLTWTRDDRGNSVAVLGQDSVIAYPDNPAHNQPSTAITAYVRARRTGTTTNVNAGLLVKRYSSSSTPWLSWGILSDPSSTKLAGHVAIVGGATDYEYMETTYVLPTTEWINGVLRWRSGTAPRLDVYGDRGDLRASAQFASAVTGTIPYAVGQPIAFNATETDAVNFVGSYSQGLLWSRYLGDTEIQALVADPYGWYSPRRSTVLTSSPYALPFGGAEMQGAAGRIGLR